MKKILALVYALVFCIGLASNAGALTLNVEAGDHPRLIFHHDNIDALRDSVSDVNHPYNEMVLEIRDNALEDIADNKVTEYYQHNYIFLAMILYDTPYYDQVFFNTAKTFVETQLASSADITGEGSSFLRFSSVALFYDWCYEQINPSLREQIANRLVLDNYGHVYSYSKYWIWDENTTVMWSYFAAVVNDQSTYGAYTNAQVIEELEHFQEHMEYDLYPCWNFFSAGAIDGYGGLRIASQIASADFFSKYTDYDPMATSTYWHGAPDFWVARYRPDGGWSRMPAKYNTSLMDGYIFAFFGNALNHEGSQFVINKMFENNKIGTGAKAGIVPAMAWYDPTKTESALDQFSSKDLEFFDEKMGVYLGRSDYDLYNTDKTITFGFFNGPDTQGHRTQNHLFVAKGDRNLLLDANHYMHDYGSNYPVYKDTYSHNAPIIWRSSANPSEVQRDCSANTYIGPWFGGQTSSNEDLGDDLYPLCNGFYGYRGEIIASDITSQYAYFVGDATEVYKDRADLVERRILVLRPGVIFVQDVIDPQPYNQSLNDIVWLAPYHSINKPTINGTITSITRGTANGGDMFSTNTTKLSVSVDDAVANVYLLPYKGQSNKVRIIGGPNSEGKYWQQNHDIIGNDDTGNRYDTYRTDNDISFEFYHPFEGKNYVPIKCNESPNMTDFNTRNRGNEYQNANSAGQWRFMVERVPSLNSEVLIQNHIIYVPEDGDDADLEFSVTPLNNGTSQVIDLVYKGKSYTITMSPDDIICVANFSIVGACCMPVTEECELRSFESCDLVGGTYLGDETVCSAGICDEEPPAGPEDPTNPSTPDTVYVNVPYEVIKTDTLWIPSPRQSTKLTIDISVESDDSIEVLVK